MSPEQIIGKDVGKESKEVQDLVDDTKVSEGPPAPKKVEYLVDPLWDRKVSEGEEIRFKKDASGRRVVDSTKLKYKDDGEGGQEIDPSSIQPIIHLTP